MALCEKILIVGFSGAGKSTLLEALKHSGRKDWIYFEDLDQLILKKRRASFKTVAELIDAEGWEKFRLWERQELEEWLKKEGKGVLALGGGTLSPMLLELYTKMSHLKLLHLKSSFDTCWGRLLKNGSEERPLVKMGKEEFKKLFDVREQNFSAIDWRLSGEDSPSKNVETFWRHVGKSE